MKSSPRFLTPDSKPFDCEIFCSQTSNKEIQLIQRALATTYENVLNVVMGGELELIKEAYQRSKWELRASQQAPEGDCAQLLTQRKRVSGRVRLSCYLLLFNI